MQKKTVVLLILDGFGHNAETKNNAIAVAHTPNWDNLRSKYPHTLINASESYVGLPRGQMGNSEVGHLTIGSGRIIYHDLERINNSIIDLSFFSNDELNKALTDLHLTNQSLHLFGLISDGGVHSHIDHYDAILKLAKMNKVNKVFIHVFLDGRDTPPRSAKKYIAKLETFCKKNGIGEIVSVCGRFYAMDRDGRWERTEAAYNLVVNHSAKFSAKSALDALEAGYARDENDEFISPTSINNTGLKIEEHDAIVFMNFRSDRARQLTNSILNDTFDGFTRMYRPKNLKYFSLTSHDKNQLRAIPIFKPIEIKNTLGEIVSKIGRKQLRIAETEKYPHVTFFFNGGEEKVYAGEERMLIPSPKVATYDLQPEMSAFELTDKLTEAIDSGKYDLIICNYANGDMVGHTGIMAAAIKAIEALDKCIGIVADSVVKSSGDLLITADHGNAEMMQDEANNQPHTQHTTNLVPFLYMNEKISLREAGNLSDIAPTILMLMNEKVPSEMTGTNLIKI